jgi:alkylated DNA repair dioxygenase AlkB
MPSSVIRSYHYDPVEHFLDVEFVSGRRYRYHEVPEETHDAMRRAFSKGEFFNANIRDQYRHSLVNGPARARVPASAPAQQSLFAAMPPGLAFREEFVSTAEESALVAAAEELPFKPFEFHGWTGNRETVSFGWRYDFSHARVEPAPPIPDFLLPLRERAATFADLRPEAFEQALVIRYDVGAGIGWHRDRPVFDRVFGLSLLSPCVLRFRRRRPGGFDRFALDAQPRSAYLLTGEIRNEWEHGIAPMNARRYSITFRSRRP